MTRDSRHLPPRQLARWFTAALALVLCAVTVALVVLAVALPGRRAASGDNELGNPPGMVDRLDFIDTREAWERGTRQRVTVTGGAPALVTLEYHRDGDYPRSGTWTSPETPAAMPFTELLPSWNVEAPRDTGLTLEVRVRTARGGRWSPWMYIGSWGRTPGADRGKRVTACRFGAVNVDYLALDVPADAYQVRANLFSFDIDRAATPSLRRIAVCCSGVVEDRQRREALLQPLAEAGASVSARPAWFRTLPVPFRTQKDAPKAISGEICSPTSVSMVMAYCGVDRPTVDNALAIYDDEHAMFGNWGRAVARAGEMGLDAWLTRFRNWDQVKPYIAQGIPVIASIRFNKGEFPGAVLPETEGHLIVIRGFRLGGDVVVNDPASRERGDGAVYRADELARAWFDHGGVGYVIRKPGAAAAENVAAASPGR